MTSGSVAMVLPSIHLLFAVSSGVANRSPKVHPLLVDPCRALSAHCAYADFETHTRTRQRRIDCGERTAGSRPGGSLGLVGRRGRAPADGLRDQPHGPCAQCHQACLAHHLGEQVLRRQLHVGSIRTPTSGRRFRPRVRCSPTTTEPATLRMDNYLSMISGQAPSEDVQERLLDDRHAAQYELGYRLGRRLIERQPQLRPAPFQGRPQRGAR